MRLPPPLQRQVPLSSPLATPGAGHPELQFSLTLLTNLLIFLNDGEN